MDTYRVWQRLDVVYRKGLFWDHFIDDIDEEVLCEMFKFADDKQKREKNLDFQYQVNDGWDRSVVEERDLGVLMSKYFKFSKQCLLTKNKANLMLCMIKRSIV